MDGNVNNNANNNGSGKGFSLGIIIGVLVYGVNAVTKIRDKRKAARLNKEAGS